MFACLLEKRVPVLIGSLPVNTNDFFYGRDEEVRKLKQRIVEKPGSVLTLAGPPGFGKTSLAAVVGKTVHVENKMDVFFLDLRGVTSVQDIESLCCKTIAEGPYEEDSLDTMVENITRPTLIIFDNAEDCLTDDHQSPGESNHLRFAKLIKRVVVGSCSKSIRVIITSRVQFCTRVRGMQPEEHSVRKISNKEAVSLLTSLCRGSVADDCQEPMVIDSEIASNLVYQVGEVPLAIQLVSTILMCGPLSAKELLDDFESSGTAALERDEYLDWFEERLLTVLEKAIKTLPEASRHHLESLAQFETSFSVNSAAAVLHMDKTAHLKRSLIPLQKRCMLEFNKDTNRYSIHPFIAMYVRDRTAENSPEIAQQHQACLCRHFIQQLMTAPQKALHPATCFSAAKCLQDEMVGFRIALKHIDKLHSEEMLPIARFMANFFPAAFLLAYDVPRRKDAERLVQACIEAAQKDNDGELEGNLLLLYAWALGMSGTRDGVDLTVIAREKAQQALQVAMEKCPNDSGNVLISSCHLMAAFLADTKAERLASAKKARDLVNTKEAQPDQPSAGAAKTANRPRTGPVIEHTLTILVTEMLAWQLQDKYEEAGQVCTKAIEVHDALMFARGQPPASSTDGASAFDESEVVQRCADFKFAHFLLVYLRNLAQYQPRVLLPLMAEDSIKHGGSHGNIIQYSSSSIMNNEKLDQEAGDKKCKTMFKDILTAGTQQVDRLQTVHGLLHHGPVFERLTSAPLAALCSVAFSLIMNDNPCQIWPKDSIQRIYLRARCMPIVEESSNQATSISSEDQRKAAELCNDVERLSTMEKCLLQVEWQVNTFY